MIYPNNDYLYIQKELFDSIAPQTAEISTVSNSLPLFLKYSVKCLFIKWLYQTVENLNNILFIGTPNLTLHRNV